MKRKMISHIVRSVVIIVTGLILISSTSVSEKDQIRIILDDVFRQNRSCKGLTVTIVMKERIGDELVKKKAYFKISYTPFNIYLKKAYPGEGVEVLYRQNVLNNRALVFPNAFPWKVMKLNPEGHLMRNGNHHSIFKSGYKFLFEVMEHLYSKYNEQEKECIKYEGLVKYADVVCHKITITTPQFGYKKYVVKKGENLETLSKRYKICDYMVYEKNPRIKSFDELKAGSEIIIPTDYGKTAMVYIDKEQHYPVGIKVFDEKGLYEEYTFTDIVINPVFGALDFDQDNPRYNFR